MMSDLNLQESKTIDLLKFVLIIGIVFIHVAPATLVIEGVYYGVNSEKSLFYYNSQFFSNVLGRISVPLFFFISGYLFFLDSKFDLQAYRKKIRSRKRSLLIPYLFWNTFTIIMYFI